MPYLPGGTLRARIARAPLSVEATLALGRTVTAALARAHARGIVHRDLKPDTILFDRQDRPLIADLGIAKHVRREGDAQRSALLTNANEPRGTFGYMAPEQMRDAASAGPTADVFALGAILYECLAGKPAFAGATLAEVMV